MQAQLLGRMNCNIRAAYALRLQAAAGGSAPGLRLRCCLGGFPLLPLLGPLLAQLSQVVLKALALLGELHSGGLVGKPPLRAAGCCCRALLLVPLHQGQQLLRASPLPLPQSCERKRAHVCLRWEGMEP